MVIVQSLYNAQRDAAFYLRQQKRADRTITALCKYSYATPEERPAGRLQLASIKEGVALRKGVWHAYALRMSTSLAVSSTMELGIILIIT